MALEIAGQNAELPEIRRRVGVFAIVVLTFFFGIAARLFFLQVLEGESYYEVTSQSVIRTEILPARRGEIRDSHGRTLATTRPSFNIELIPTRMTQGNYESLLERLKDHPTPLPDWDTWQTLVADRMHRPYVLAEDVSRDVMASIETSMDMRGIHIRTQPRRHYPHGTLAAHTLGYLNEVSADDLREFKDEDYRPGDLIGRTGLEKQWEPYLRGRKGFRKYVIARKDIRQADIRIQDLVDGPISAAPVPGENLILTVDIDIQKAAERALSPYRAGSAVVIDIHTGRVLGLASRPGFDPNTMSGRLSIEAADRLFSNPLRPLRDRTVSDTFNPGSTFKVVTALAALEAGILTPDERTKCNKFVQVGRRRFRCTKVHKSVNLHQALVQSCNVFFYELAQRPGMMDRISTYATEMGLGAPTGLGYNAEQPGFVPTEHWHRERDSDHHGNGFNIGHALNTAIGEGATRVTTMQMAVLYAAIANGGTLWLPQIIQRIESADGKVLETFEPRIRKTLAIDPEHLALVRSAMVGVVADPKGTAHRAQSSKASLAGKTGTAQVRRRSQRPGEILPPNALRDHAWFAGFTPAENPQIAFAVLIENGGYGGEVAAPVAVQIAEKIEELRIARLQEQEQEKQEQEQEKREREKREQEEQEQAQQDRPNEKRPKPGAHAAASSSPNPMLMMPTASRERARHPHL